MEAIINSLNDGEPIVESVSEMEKVINKTNKMIEVFQERVKAFPAIMEELGLKPEMFYSIDITHDKYIRLQGEYKKETAKVFKEWKTDLSGYLENKVEKLGHKIYIVLT